MACARARGHLCVAVVLIVLVRRRYGSSSDDGGEREEPLNDTLPQTSSVPLSTRLASADFVESK
jgi:hypothetical protein